MSKILTFIAIIIVLSCSKQVENKEGMVQTTKTISAKVNDKAWLSRGVASSISTAASSYSYYTNLSADGKTLSLMAYGTTSELSNQPADKLGIVISPFAGAGRYAINSSRGSKAVFASLNAASAPVDIYNADDNVDNFINIETSAGNKISGTFSFTAVSATTVVRVSNGIFSNVAY